MAPLFLLYRALLLIIISISSQLCFCKNSSSTLSCNNEDREALLKIKLSIYDQFNLLKSWESKRDCCKWKGVGCDAASGHVIKLALLPHMTVDEYNSYDDYTTDAYPDPSLWVSELSPYLVELKHLNHLDLSGIVLFNASSTSIPEFIGGMKKLRYLNLSNVNFEGKIPHVLGNLTNLEVFDLSDVYGLAVDDIMWVSSLVALKYLDISHVDLEKTHNGLQLLGTLPWLSHLALGNCGLETSFMSHSGRLFNSTPLFANLQYLDLSRNYWTGPNVLRNMTTLKYLDLSRNDLARTHYDVLQVLGMLPSLSYLALRDCRLDGSQLSHGPLFNLTLLAKLQYLDLSMNGLGGEVPSWLRNMTVALTYLDLSLNSFNSSVPMWFDSFESLVHLDLSGNNFTKIEGGLSHFIRGKCNLRYLYLDNINIKGHLEIGSENYSSSTTSTSGFLCGGDSSKLETLIARYTQLSGSLFDFIGHLKNLRTLVLIGNSFSGPIPNQILATITGLRHLVLGDNQLEGTLDANTLGKLTNLVRLDLSRNKLEGEIPQLLFVNMLQLKYLDISNNQLQGAISQLHFANLSMLWYLDISINKLSIDLQHPGWVPPFQLLVLGMSSCNFEAQFPKWIQTQTEVTMLDLSNSNISGDIQEMLSTSTQWKYSYLSHNNIGGRILRLPPSIEYLDLSYNLISGIMIGNVSNSKLFELNNSPDPLSGVIPLHFKDKNLRYLMFLLLNDNHLNGSIPTSLCYLESLEVLDLSTNHLSGTIPNCWGHSSNIFIDFSSNRLSGNIPISLGNLTNLNSLHLNNNSLHGDIPYSLGTLKELKLLDLGENKLSGNLPAWIGQNLTFLRVLKLRGNHLTGYLPVEICSLSVLRILDLGGNELGGRIPHCLGHMNGMSQSFSKPPEDLLSYDRIIMLTKGLELEYTTILDLVVALDLSSNKFVGSIPENITLLVGLKSLNLSHNFLSGNIPRKIGDLKKLESLDLSNNHLSGSIPSSISNLASLSKINLSYNNLQGRVPRSTQLDTLDDSKHSIYAGNPLLCGEQLSKKCPGDREEPVPSPREEHDDDVSEKMMFYIGVMLGIVTGFGGVVVTLVLNKTWRVAYFNFAEDAMRSVYVTVKVKMNKIKRRRMGGA